MSESESEDSFDELLRDLARRQRAYLEAVSQINAADPMLDCIRKDAIRSIGAAWGMWDPDDQRWATIAMLTDLMLPGAPTGWLADGDRLALSIHELLNSAWRFDHAEPRAKDAERDKLVAASSQVVNVARERIEAAAP